MTGVIVVVALDTHQVLTFVINHHLVVFVVHEVVVVGRLLLRLLTNSRHPRASHYHSVRRITIHSSTRPFLALPTTSGLGSERG